jgi:hypothetical protein
MPVQKAQQKVDRHVYPGVPWRIDALPLQCIDEQASDHRFEGHHQVAGDKHAVHQQVAPAQVMSISPSSVKQGWIGIGQFKSDAKHEC